MTKKVNSELEDAVKLADRLLDVPMADPDDDLRMLSRQLLRRQEAVGRLATALIALKAAIGAPVIHHATLGPRWVKPALDMADAALKGCGYDPEATT